MDKECGFGMGVLAVVEREGMMVGKPVMIDAPMEDKGVGDGEVLSLLRSLRVICGRDCESSAASVMQMTHTFIIKAWKEI